MPLIKAVQVKILKGVLQKENHWYLVVGPAVVNFASMECGNLKSTA